jgi:lipopolysaccharide transport system permease protein
MLRIPGRHFSRNLIERRALLYQLVVRDFEQRFVGSAAGWMWTLIHPLVLLASWTYVFQVCLKMHLPATEVTQNYTLWMFSGYLPWLLFQETVNRSSTSLVEHSNLITKTVFPAEVVPISVFFSTLLSHLMALILMLVVIGIWLGHFSAVVLMLPIYMALTGLFAVGIGWIFASLQVYLRDTAQVLLVILTFWFWITPIMIPESQVPPRFQFLIQVNPMAYVVKAYRNSLLSNHLPDTGQLLLLGVWAGATFVIGGLFFRHLKRGFADVL